MELHEHEKDMVEDERMLKLARSQGRHGVETARIYATILRRRSIKPLAELRFDEAITMAEREFEFCSRAFGLTHRYSRAAQQNLHALRMQAESRLAELQSSVDFCFVLSAVAGGL